MLLRCAVSELFGPPTQRGFFCDDDSIKLPYKENTIGSWEMLYASLIIPLVFIFLTEIWHHGFRAKSMFQLGRLRLAIPRWFHQTTKLFAFYLLVFACSFVTGSFGKFTIGRLRPYFLDVCKPDIDCDGPGAPKDYISNFTCTGNPKMALEARVSFPSAHSNAACLCAIYVFIYLNNSKTWRRHGCLTRLVQFVLLLAAWWVSLTRVMDNWHHWSDVFAGAVLGAFFAVAAAEFTQKLSNATREERDESFLKRNDNKP